MGAVKATDAESSFVTYNLIGGDTNRYFILNSGMIYVGQSLKGVNDNRDELIVRATDTGIPSRSTNATVSIYWYLASSSLKAQTALHGVVAPCYQFIARCHNSMQRSLIF